MPARSGSLGTVVAPILLANRRAIAAKDLRESTASGQVLAPVVIIPLVFVVAYPVGLLLSLRSMSSAGAHSYFAKIPASVFPAIAGLTALVDILGTPLVGQAYFPTPNWWVLMLLVVPAVAVFVTGCVVWVSSRVATYQEANSIAGAVVLPVILLVVGQSAA